MESSAHATLCIQLTMYQAVVCGYDGLVVRFTQYVNKEHLNIKGCQPGSQINSIEYIVCYVAVQGHVRFRNPSAIFRWES